MGAPPCTFIPSSHPGNSPQPGDGGCTRQVVKPQAALPIPTTFANSGDKSLVREMCSIYLDMGISWNTWEVKPNQTIYKTHRWDWGSATLVLRSLKFPSIDMPSASCDHLDPSDIGMKMKCHPRLLNPICRLSFWVPLTVGLWWTVAFFLGVLAHHNNNHQSCFRGN